MKYLGIDFGLKHLGLAIAAGPLAEPWGEKTNNDRVFKYLTDLIISEAVDKAVIGLPEGKLAAPVKEFGGKLSRLSGKEVIFHDETLSTWEARRKLIEAGKPKLKRRRDHAAAAALILQNFLDMIS